MDDTSNPVIETIRATIKKLNDLFLKECLKTQNHYLDEISSMTGKYLFEYRRYLSKHLYLTDKIQCNMQC